MLKPHNSGLQNYFLLKNLYFKKIFPEHKVIFPKKSAEKPPKIITDKNTTILTLKIWFWELNFFECLFTGGMHTCLTEIKNNFSKRIILLYIDFPLLFLSTICFWPEKTNANLCGRKYKHNTLPGKLGDSLWVAC